MTRRIAPLLAVFALLAAVPTARATEPSSGKVSKASPKASWTGAVTGFAAWQLYNQGQSMCNDPSCDTFTLEVADGPAPLVINVKSSDSNIFVEVVKPDGSKELFGGPQMAVKGTIKNAANGTYTINIAQNEQTQGAHEGTAELVFPAPPPAPAPVTTPVAALPAPAAVVLGVKAGRLSARKLRSLTVTASAPVRALKAVLKRGAKTVATGSLASVNGSATIRLKLRGRPRPGTHTLKLTAVDGQGRAVSRTVKLRLGR